MNTRKGQNVIIVICAVKPFESQMNHQANIK